MKKSFINQYYKTNKENKFLLYNSIIEIVNKIIENINKKNLNIYERRDSPEALGIEYIAKIRDQLQKFAAGNKDLDKLEFLLHLAGLSISNQVQVFDVEYDACPAQFSVAFPQKKSADQPRWRHAWGLSGGRGRTIEAARIGALGEAAECMSVWSRGPDDPLIVSPASMPAATAFPNAAQLLNLSSRQLADLRARHAGFREPRFPHELQHGDFNNRLLQYQDKNSGSVIFVPSLVGLVDEESHHGIIGERLTSTNGTAVAESFSTASDKAMFELIERDAVSLWWYNRVRRARLPPALVQAACGEDLACWLSGRERQFHVLDLSTDLGVPIAGALSYEADGSMIADGYAAGGTWAQALVGAVLEMLQAEISLSFMEQKAERDAASGVSIEEDSFYRRARRMNLFAQGFMTGAEIALPGASAEVDLSADDALACLSENGIQIYVADITRPEIGVPAARAVSPQLRDWQPRFGPGRLYDVPVKMGWREKACAEAALNPVPFPS